MRRVLLALLALFGVVAPAQGNTTAAYHYDRAGNRVGLIQGGVNSIATVYDGLNRVAGITGLVTSGNTTAYTYTLAYDEFGNLRAQVEGVLNGNRTVTMSYDLGNRLTQEAIGLDSDGNYNNSPTLTTRNYTYDAGDNRLGEMTAIAVGNATATVLENVTFNYRADNALLSAAWTANGANYTANYTVNGAGSETGSTTQVVTPGHAHDLTLTETYAYDWDNRLVQRVEKRWSGQGTILPTLDEMIYDNIYDYRGRQLAQTQDDVNQQTYVLFNNYQYTNQYAIAHTWRLFSGGLAEREYDLGNTTAWALNLTGANLTREYVRGSDMGGGVGGVLWDMGPGVGPNFYNYDARGDVMTGGGYTADGYHGGSDVLPGLAGGSGRLQANTKMEEGANYMLLNDGQRYRDVFSGRFLTRDPMGYIDGTNEFNYVRNNPWGSFDAEGLLVAKMLPEWMQRLLPEGAKIADHILGNYTLDSSRIRAILRT